PPDPRAAAARSARFHRARASGEVGAGTQYLSFTLRADAARASAHGRLDGAPGRTTHPARGYREDRPTDDRPRLGRAPSGERRSPAALVGGGAAAARPPLRRA